MFMDGNKTLNKPDGVQADAKAVAAAGERCGASDAGGRDAGGVMPAGVMPAA